MLADNRTVSCSNTCLPCASEQLTCGQILAMNNTIPDRKFNKKFKRKVIMSSDMTNLFYSWFAPITSLVWYQLNWTPVVIFVDSNTASKTDKRMYEFIMKQVEAAGGEVIRISNTLPQPHYSPGMVTTASRFAACVEDWPEDTYVITSDLDMWLLDNATFEKHLSVPSSAHIFDSMDVSQYAVCYIGMNVSLWRDIMGFKKGDGILEVVAGMRQERTTKEIPMKSQWSTDQLITTNRIKRWKGYPHLIHFYGHRDRKLNQDRLDRTSSADKFVYGSKYLDAHLLRPGFSKLNWKKLMSLSEHLLNAEQMEFVINYAKHFCYMIQCTNTNLSESAYSVSHPQSPLSHN